MSYYFGWRGVVMDVTIPFDRRQFVAQVADALNVAGPEPVWDSMELRNGRGEVVISYPGRTFKELVDKLRSVTV